MRFRELDLIAYGPFTDRRLQFGSPGEHDFHLLVGRNEAGKSTTLRAIEALLFGFPHAIGEDQLHNADRQRVAAILQLAAGTGSDRDAELEFSRVRGRTRSLRDPGDEPLPVDALEPYLGGIDKKLYERLFLVTHQELVEGGEGLLEGGGEFGISVFGASFGSGNLSAIRERLVREAGELFKPSANATTPQINAALRSYRSHRAAERELGVAPRDYDRAATRLEAAIAAHQRAGAAVRAGETQVRSLARLDAVSGLLVRRGLLLSEIATLSHVPELGADAAGRRQRELDRRDRAQREVRTVEARIDECKSMIAAIDMNGIERSSEEPGGPSVSAIDADRVRAIEALVDEQTQLQERQRTAALAAQRAERTLDRFEAEHEPTGLLADDTGRLQSWVDALADQQGAEQADRHQAQNESGERSELLAAALALRPPLEFDELRSVTGPSQAQIERCAVAQRECREQLEQAQSEQRRLVREIDAERLRLSPLLGSGIEQLTQRLSDARTSRDRLLDQLHGELDAGEITTAKATRTALADSVGVADQLADELLARADQVAEHDHGQARIAELERQLGEAERQLASVDGASEAVAQEWHALWAGSNVEPLDDAQAMLTWSQRRGELARQLTDLDQRESARRARERERAAIVEQVNAELASLAAPAPVDLPSAQLLEHARKVIKDHQSRVNSELLLEQERDSARAAVKQARQALEDVDSQQAEWAVRWSQTLHDLPLKADALPARLREAVRQINELAARESDLAGAERDLARQVADLEGAKQALAELCRVAGVSELEELPEIEAEAARREKLRDELEGLDSLIRERGEGSIEALEAELGGRTGDQLATELADAQDELTRTRAVMETAIAERTEAETELRGLDHQEQAARERELAESDAARVALYADNYLAGRTAITLLDRAIEYHREHNSSPILKRAETLLAQLTAGSLTRLLLDAEDSERPVLVARRPDGAELSVAQMSDGTRDQLYLALRLAALEHHVVARRPLPVLLDDILVHFDDQRVAATLPALAELAALTQVILLTHHEHIATLAADVLGDEVRIHRLSD